MYISEWPGYENSFVGLWVYGVTMEKIFSISESTIVLRIKKNGTKF